ncbi:hypothetical protein [Chryseobacterium sp.]|uniref:hypothetical protein n=1 Tax=Chryseobacterium sp. TaxID=1871047 RepID=UPI0011CA90E5|nr:hypothetical protein [Chryseobacterium sp.]TXF78834.1 hypothetical protein FUA25_00095 [Chryseobacterium sp.]
MKNKLLTISAFALMLSLSNCTQDGRNSMDLQPEPSSTNAVTLKSNLLSFNKNFKYAPNSNVVNGKKWWQ